MKERVMLACNHAGGRFIPDGSLAFVRWENRGGGNDRIPVFVRTKGGRWVNKWERIDRLDNFRAKTVVEHHPAFHANAVAFDDRVEAEERARQLQATRDGA